MCIYSNDANGWLGNVLGSLNGSSDPSTAGIYTYTASDIVLESSTTYWIVIECTTSLTVGSYTWSETDRTSYSGNWDLGMGHYSSNNGSTWGRTTYICQYAINATAVPEPSTVALLALGAGVLWQVRRKQNDGCL